VTVGTLSSNIGMRRYPWMARGTLGIMVSNLPTVSHRYPLRDIAFGSEFDHRDRIWENTSHGSAAAGPCAAVPVGHVGRRCRGRWISSRRLGLELACVGPRSSFVQRTATIRDRNTPSRIESQPLTRDQTGAC
jgi:hypothetical protein